jgi:hypothetical protein
VSDYGYCPMCGAPGRERERRLNGNDICERGHLYPSLHALEARPDTLSSLDAALTRLREAEEFIREVAWRFSDHASANWSGPDVLAHVADYFGTTVAELGRRMEKAARGD